MAKKGKVFPCFSILAKISEDFLYFPRASRYKNETWREVRTEAEER